MVDEEKHAITQDDLDKAITRSEDKHRVRFDAIDRATELLHQDSVRVPTAIDRALSQLRELFTVTVQRIEDVADQKFSRVDVAFAERDKRSEQLTVATQAAAQQLALANAAAIAAALQAQKEAADKSEKNTIESIRSLQALFQTAMAGMTTNVNDIKSRLDKGEGRDRGHDQSWGWLVGSVGIFVGLVSAIGATIIVITTLVRH